MNVDGFRNVFRQKVGGGMLQQARNPDDFLDGWEVQVSKRTEDRWQEIDDNINESQTIFYGPVLQREVFCR